MAVTVSILNCCCNYPEFGLEVHSIVVVVAGLGVVLHFPHNRGGGLRSQPPKSTSTTATVWQIFGAGTMGCRGVHLVVLLGMFGLFDTFFLVTVFYQGIRRKGGILTYDSQSTSLN